MIYVKILQKDFNQWNLHLKNIWWEKNYLELVKWILAMFNLQPQQHILGFTLINKIIILIFLLQL